jgi:oligopeptidase A
VLSADAFMAVVKEGIFTTELSQRYKECILAKGGSKSMSELYKEFMQREPKTQALLQLSGIK